MKWREFPWRQWADRGRHIIGKYKFILLVFFAGLVLLLLPSPGGEISAAPAAAEHISFDLRELEEELSQALSRVDGAGEVSVVLTLRSGSRQILAQDTETDQRESSIQTSQTTVVISQGSGVEQPVMLQEIYPTFQWALIICEGGDQPSVQLKLTEAVSALTGLTSDKISICKGK